MREGYSIYYFFCVSVATCVCLSTSDFEDGDNFTFKVSQEMLDSTPLCSHAKLEQGFLCLTTLTHD